MKRHVRKVAVLGSGVMGSAIAAHFANAGVSSLVLDIVPNEPNAAEKAAGLTLKDRVVRDRLAAESVKALLKAKPAPLFSAERLAFIEVGNFEDDLPRIGEADWVVEVVKEDLEIKKKVLTAAAPHVGVETVLSSNTSGLSLTEMASVLPEALKPRFLGTHFFNPPRYMKLLEVISTADTAPEVLAFIETFSRTRLGKGIVPAKDTPNFIANRVGTYSLMFTLRLMEQMGFTVEEIDALTGPALGRPKTATFRLADLVGLDTLLHVAENVRQNALEDESRDAFAAPAFLREMVEKGLLGRKVGAGFYKKVKGAEGSAVLTLDLETFEYREGKKASFSELEAVKSIDDPLERLSKLAFGKGRAAEAVWKMLAATLWYSAMRVGDICDDVSAVDRAIRWGFNWEAGPFETWDALGFRAVTERLKAEKYELPEWVEALYDAGAESIYRRENGSLRAPSAKPGVLASVPVDPRAVEFEILRRAGNEIRRNAGASLLDLGDGVFGLEFHSKMNVIGQDTISMIMTACKETETNGQALIVANQAENFSVGANLMLLLMEAQEGNWDEIDAIVRQFQAATSRLEQCAVPVVTVPHGLTLGGGCEITMAGNAIRAAAETYIGLVEFGAGVVPAGGGCLRLYKRNVAALPDPSDLYPALRKTFETIGMAKMATSAEEARDLGFLRPQDTWSMNGDHRVADAKDLALAMARAGFEPPRPEWEIPVMGNAGMALVESVLFNMQEGGYISEHDRKIGRELGRVLSGGNVPGPTHVSEQHMLDLERESFLRLCGERKSLERMQAILKTGKPLRN
ncbi:MAG: 3-hydroxyacyl-CoA dehydrogenase/enoyl-CoA hydratase family protein [Gemmatimonadota bacterium]|nr:MAG: 3-hydroxyacyl-CoA dehydrogenase/enoyl-CoA hydratase family protein [Gemmatimonadota bacterium]